MRHADEVVRPPVSDDASGGHVSLLGPIFVREWLTVPRQPRHYWMRAAYLGLLWVLGLTAWQYTIGWEQTATLGDNARFGFVLFQVLTYYIQLPLLLFFSALSAASAVAREKDRRTFVLLLMTDLRNYEIVLGKLLGSLLQIVLLLGTLVPFLFLLVLLGGVAPGQVVQATLIMAATALAAGSLGSLIALWRDKTFPALALTALFLILYLCLVEGLGKLPVILGWFGGGSASLQWLSVESWQNWLNPFHAMRSVLETSAETATAFAPAYGFAAAMVGLTLLLNGWAIIRLRVWNPSGEPIMQREAPGTEAEEDKDRAAAHAAPGALRKVWANPILWREMCTRAYGRRPLLVKIAYLVVLGLICTFALEPLFTSGPRNPYLAAYGLVSVGVLSLLLVSAQAVTAITSERDTGALDLLLVTDLTPQEFIFGKLWGICYNAKEYLLPPFILAVIYGCYGMLATPPRAHPEMALAKNLEAMLCIEMGVLILMTFGCVLGVHVALRNINSQTAIINTLGTIFFLSAGTGFCIKLILINSRFESQWFSFIFFLAAGIGGLLWVLSADRPSGALTLASFLCPPAVFYAVTTILIARPGSEESGDPLVPFLAVGGAFSFTVAAMLVPLLSEFDVALGRTTAGQE